MSIDDGCGKVEIAKRAVMACILIGGASRRMGTPKHLLVDDGGLTRLERTVNVLEPLVTKCWLAGRGEVPCSLAALGRIDDAKGVVGPLAGILGAMRRQPEVAWLVVACDMPKISIEAVSWLLAQRRSDCAGVVPVHDKLGRASEPLFACYEPSASELFETLVAGGKLRARAIAEDERVHLALIPPDLRGSWDNINTPEQWCDYLSSAKTRFSTSHS